MKGPYIMAKNGKYSSASKPVGYSRYDKPDPRRLGERIDFLMAPEGYTSTANLSTKVVYKEFDQVGYKPDYALDSTRRD